MRFLELLLFFIACIAAAQVTENHNFRVTTSLSAPPDASIYIKSFTYGGTGCPYGSVGHFISSNSLSAMVIFDYMRPAIGPGIAVTENRKNCQISLAIGADPGWRFRVNGRGTWLLMNMSFGKGISAAFKATYYMSGSTNQSVSETLVQGLVVGPIEKVLPSNNGTSILSPCGGGILNINESIRLTSTISNVIGSYPDDGDLEPPIRQDISIDWEQC